MQVIDEAHKDEPISFSDAEFAGKRKKTRREVFLEEMQLGVPRKALLGLTESHYPVAGLGIRPFRAHFRAKRDRCVADHGFGIPNSREQGTCGTRVSAW